MRAALLLALVLAAPARAHDFSAFGGRCDGITDDTPAWNAAMESIRRPAKDRRLDLPAGGCMFYSTPDPIPEGSMVQGQGKNTTVLRRAYSRGLFLVLEGTGVTLRDLSLYAEPGTEQGTGIYAEATDEHVGGGHVIEHLWVTGAGTWSAPINLDGSARTIAPLGMRTVSMQDVHVFNATWWLFSCWSCVGLHWSGGGAYQGIGTSKGVAIGGPGAAANRVDAIIDWSASAVYPGALR